MHQYLQMQTMNANDDGPFIKKLGIKKKKAPFLSIK
jgi:hypothetical protein